MNNPYAGIPSSIWLLNIITFISKSGNVILVFYPLFLATKLSIDIVTIGHVLSCYGIGAIIGSYLGGRFCDTLGCQKVLKIGLFLAGINYVSFEFISSIALIFVCMFFAGFFISAVRPATSELIASFCSEKLLSRAYAMNYQAINLGNTIGPAIGGALAQVDYVWIFRLDGLANQTPGRNCHA